MPPTTRTLLTRKLRAPVLRNPQRHALGLADSGKPGPGSQRSLRPLSVDLAGRKPGPDQYPELYNLQYE